MGDMIFNIGALTLLFVLTIYLGGHCIEEFRNWRKRQRREEGWFFEDLQKWLDGEDDSKELSRDEDKQC